MNQRDYEKIQELLKTAIPPVADPELKRDLWPQMLQKLGEGPVRVSWLDWALVALVMVWLLVFPEAIPGLLYHL
jgi:hypothetical protein